MRNPLILAAMLGAAWGGGAPDAPPRASDTPGRSNGLGHLNQRPPRNLSPDKIHNPEAYAKAQAKRARRAARRQANQPPPFQGPGELWTFKSEQFILPVTPTYTLVIRDPVSDAKVEISGLSAKEINTLSTDPVCAGLIADVIVGVRESGTVEGAGERLKAQLAEILAEVVDLEVQPHSALIREEHDCIEQPVTYRWACDIEREGGGPAIAVERWPGVPEGYGFYGSYDDETPNSYDTLEEALDALWRNGPGWVEVPRG